MVCCLCCKKQSFIVNDFPLAPSISDFRICNVCDEQLRLTRDDNKDLEYLLECLKNTELDARVISYVNALIIEHYKKIEDDTESLLKQQEQSETRKKETIEQKARREAINSFATVGCNFEGYRIAGYLKTISAEAILGTGFLSEFSANFSDFIGTESNMFSKKFSAARDSALQKLIVKADSINANALIGLTFDHISFARYNMIGVTATATAVVIEKL